MKNAFDFIAAHADWIMIFVPLVFMLVWMAIESRWEAYTRRKNYEELEILHDLREKSIITQKEYDEKKEELLSA